MQHGLQGELRGEFPLQICVHGTHHPQGQAPGSGAELCVCGPSASWAGFWDVICALMHTKSCL